MKTYPPPARTAYEIPSAQNFIQEIKEAAENAVPPPPEAKAVVEKLNAKRKIKKPNKCPDNLCPSCKKYIVKNNQEDCIESKIKQKEYTPEYGVTSLGSAGVINCEFYTIDITDPPQSEEKGIDITKPPMPEQTPEKLTPEQRKEICKHADGCKNPTKCSDECNNRPDRPPIQAPNKIAEAFYTCKMCGTTKNKALVPNPHTDLFEGTLVCQDCRQKLDKKAAELPAEKPAEAETLQKSERICPRCKNATLLPLVFNEKFPKAQICNVCDAEVNALTEATREETLDKAVDAFEQATQPAETKIDNHDIPETSDADKLKDIQFQGAGMIIKNISDQFKQHAITHGISEKDMPVFVAWMKLETDAEGTIIHTSRLMDLNSVPDDIKYFAETFNKRLKEAA